MCTLAHSQRDHRLLSIHVPLRFINFPPPHPLPFKIEVDANYVLSSKVFIIRKWIRSLRNFPSPLLFPVLPPF